jgi:EAL domain-containing protein (putative c-di-GMP-specific phosphodiesterase class I)
MAVVFNASGGQVPSESQLPDVVSEFARAVVTDLPIGTVVERVVDVRPTTSAGVTLILPGAEPSFIAGPNDAASASPAADVGLATVFSFPLRHGGPRMAKRAGGRRHEVFDRRDQHLASHEAGLERELRDLSARGELHLDYQPIVATSNGRVMGVEALLRWAHPSHGLVPPSVLIPLAERARLIPAIGKWVLETAMAEQAHWRHDFGVDDLAVSVNVSAHQLMWAGFVDDVAAVLESSPSDPGQLILEMTESVFVRDDQRALLVLDDLKALGVKLALDDFGTGYSSLAYLLRFPVDTVKIDQVFVAGLGHDNANQAIVSAVTQLAHNLGLTVIAEGVETLEQYQALVELRSDLCQGFYLAHPMPGAQLDLLIERRANGSDQSLPVGPPPGRQAQLVSSRQWGSPFRPPRRAAHPQRPLLPSPPWPPFGPAAT